MGGGTEQDEPIHNWQLNMLNRSIGGPVSVTTHRRILEAAQSYTADRYGANQYKLLYTAVVLCLITIVAIDVIEGFGERSTAAIVVFAIAYAWHRVIDKKRWRRKLGWALEQENIRPLNCLVCDYDLKGSQSVECPECRVTLAPIEADHESDDTQTESP